MLPTRWFSNHESPLLSRSHTIANIVILVQTPWEYMKECKYCDNFSKLYQKVNDPKMTFDPTPVDVTWVILPKDHFILVP